MTPKRNRRLCAPTDSSSRSEQDAGGSPNSPREALYWVFILTLIPLAFSLLGGRDDDFIKRLEHTVNNSPPEVRQRVENVISHLKEGKGTEEELFQALPEHKLDSSALLARDSMLHWVFAALAAGGFLALIAFFFVRETVKPLHLLFVGLFTGTIGIIFLFAVQFAARFSQSLWLTRGNVIILLIFYIVKFIGWSYSSALDPESNFFLSAIGFTFGVGLCEELCKALPIIVYYHQHANRSSMGWRGACLWGLASGIGFGVSEGIMYSGDKYNGIFGWDSYLVRFVSCVALHAMWSASTSMTLYRRRDLLHDLDEWHHYALGVLRIVAVPMVSARLLRHIAQKRICGRRSFGRPLELRLVRLEHRMVETRGRHGELGIRLASGLVST